ncbi:hypothetical protein F2Q70_00031862 [Brassica cretica]|nr:hypothetical protein F2Q70_00031862 [Brassica cretica]
MLNRRIVGDDEGRLLDAKPKDCQRRRREDSGCRTEGSLETTKGGFWMPNRRILGDDEGRFLSAFTVTAFDGAAFDGDGAVFDGDGAAFDGDGATFEGDGAVLMGPVRHVGVGVGVWSSDGWLSGFF